MKRTIAMLAGLLALAGLSGIASAGVVIDEQVTSSQGGAPAVTRTRQLLVQGHKEKMVSEHNMFVIDLDRGTMILIDPNQKAYAEMPFPPQGMSSNPGQQLDLNFKKTGKSSRVLNYSCEEYSGAGKTPMASVSTSGCFSGGAPGAAEFTEFTRAMGAKLKDANAMAGKMPSGIPLTMDSTRTMNAGFSVPGMTPGQSAQMKEMIAKQSPQTTKTVVTKIATRALPPDTFAAPAGYERRTMSARPPGGTGAGAPAPPSAKSPE
jgi:uncharacterized protein DUF4412